MKNFEEYLREKFIIEYTGTDDDAPDAFDEWITDLCVHEWLEYGDKYAKIISKSEPH